MGGYVAKVIERDALLHLRHPIVLRENLDAKKRRTGKDLLVRFLSGNSTDIWNTEARRFDLYPLFRKDMDSVLVAPIVEKGAQSHLKSAMVSSTQVAPNECAVDILAVWTIARAEILLDREEKPVPRHRNILSREESRTANHGH